jgi:NADPH:quinone reductase
VLPDAVSDAQAATLPTAGLTALRSLAIGGLLLGRRVLVTGATGGVGGFAVQLAGLSGADVHTEMDGDFDLIVDAVGGEKFAAAIEHLAPRGIVVSLATNGDDELISFRAARFDRSPGAGIYTLNLPDELDAHGGGAADLARLVALVGDGLLDCRVALEASWHDARSAMDALLERRFRGEAVLYVD